MHHDNDQQAKRAWLASSPRRARTLVLPLKSANKQTVRDLLDRSARRLGNPVRRPTAARPWEPGRPAAVPDPGFTSARPPIQLDGYQTNTTSIAGLRLPERLLDRSTDCRSHPALLHVRVFWACFDWRCPVWWSVDT